MNEESNQTVKHERTEKEIEIAYKIYGEEVAELRKLQLSNTENYDKTITMLSSAGLALSLTFITKIAPVESIKGVGYLQLSWTFYFFAIMAGLVAYIISNKGIDHKINIAERYYIQGDMEAANEKLLIFKFTNLTTY